MSPAKQRVCGPFVPDPDLGADLNGRRVCANCHLPGAPDDPHHTLPDVGQDARGLAAGEGGEE